MRLPSVTDSVVRWRPRRICMEMTWPGLRVETRARTSEIRVDPRGVDPLDGVAALQPGAGRGAVAGDRAHHRTGARRGLRPRDHAEVGHLQCRRVVDARQHGVGGVNGNRERQPLRRIVTAGDHLRVDPDHAPIGVEQRRPGVVGAHGLVGLDDVVDLVAVGGLDLVLERGHDSAGERPVHAEGVADRQRGIADAHRGRVPQREGANRGHAVHVAVEHGEVVVGVHGHDAGVAHERVLEFDGDALGAVRPVDHVVVGEDVAAPVHHEAGARGGRTLPRVEEVEGAGHLLEQLGAHEHHAGGVALVDVVQSQAGEQGPRPPRWRPVTARRSSRCAGGPPLPRPAGSRRRRPGRRPPRRRNGNGAARPCASRVPRHRLQFQS